MLNKFRDKLSIIPNSLARYLVYTGFKAWQISIAGLLLTVIAGYSLITLVGYDGVTLSAVIYLLAGFMDSLDGAVARLRKEVSRWGGIFDAYLDRIEEGIYILFIQASWLKPDPLNTLSFLFLSLLISYGRAKAGEYNIKLSGIGLMERAERIIGLAIGLILLRYIGDINIIFVILNILLLFTFFERFYRIYKAAGKA